MNLDFGKFLNFRQDELVRGFSLVIDFRLMKPPSPLDLSTSTTDIVIATITSDVELSILFRGSSRRVSLAYRKTDNAW